MEVKGGDIVSLAQDAVYYDGKGMPGWVKNDRWIIKSIHGDRAVLGRNVSGTNDINSPVNVKFLTVSGTGAPLSQTPSQAVAQTVSSQPASKPDPAGEMVISDRAVEMIAKYEGCRLDAYKCPAGIWTIGYGHTAGVKPGDKLPSQEAAKKLLKDDLKKYGASVNNCVKKGMITFPLNQNQFDALTSFCYNCGAGSLQKLVTGRDAATVAEKFLAYNKGGGKVLPGLDRRRKEERALFLS